MKELFNECISRDYNCSITYQRINDYSVEIYTGYKSTYKLIFYSDGHLTHKKAVNEGLKFLLGFGYKKEEKQCR